MVKVESRELDLTENANVSQQQSVAEQPVGMCSAILSGDLLAWLDPACLVAAGAGKSEAVSRSPLLSATL